MVAGFSDEVSAAWSTRAVAPGGSYCDRRVGTDLFAQCAQGKDLSRVTERVPPIFRSIEDNGSSAAISRKAGGSFRDAPCDPVAVAQPSITVPPCLDNGVCSYRDCSPKFASSCVPRHGSARGDQLGRMGQHLLQSLCCVTALSRLCHLLCVDPVPLRAGEWIWYAFSWSTQP